MATTEKKRYEITTQPTGPVSTAATGTVARAEDLPNANNKGKMETWLGPDISIADAVSFDPNAGPLDGVTGTDWNSMKNPGVNAPAGTNEGTAGGAGIAAGSTAPTFNDTYGAQLKAQYDAIVNRQPFSYNAAEDPLYQQYVDKYVQGGRLAMRDSMGQAAALTGGYGSSYGQAVGQQQYNEYMRSLADVMPELYGQAYEQYQDEGDRMLQNYQLLSEQSDDAYAKYRDAYSDYIYNEQMTYDRQQDAYQNLQNIIAATGMIPTEEQLAAAGMSAEEARALRMEYAREDPKAAVRKGIITEDEYKQITGKKYKGSSGGNYSKIPDKGKYGDTGSTGFADGRGYYPDRFYEEYEKYLKE